jgi:cytochrome c
MSRQKLLIACGVVSLGMGLWTLSSIPQQPVATDGKPRRVKTAQPKPVPLPENCGEKLTGPRIDFNLPADVEGKLQQQKLYLVQRAADIFSWQEFVALNWPAQPGMRGEPDRSAVINRAGPRVWETWKETDEVYLLKGIQPPAWNSPEQLPSHCAGTKVLSRRQKVDDEVDSTAQAAKANKTLPATLTDQRGNLVRYEIRMNKVLFDYIVKNKLYNGDVQTQTDAVSYPDGSILIKASWRELLPEDEPRYLTVEACVCDKVNHELSNCRTRKMGLVGLHIMQKTRSAPQFIWSTFEQIDNVTSHSGRHPSFNNPYCESCQPNRQTQPHLPNQVTRLIPIPSANPNCDEPSAAVDNIHALNQAMQQALAEKKSVLQYYELVNTQWPLPSGANKQSPTVFTAIPALLANTTMETFIQESSSCMGCHAMARTLRTDQFVSSDFSFTLNNAYPRPPTPQMIPPPTVPVTDWDRENWNSILRGKQLTDQTYELLPTFVPKARLHCGSCHLNSGGNPDAAWWVGMTVKYAYPQTNKLQVRINKCFTHSLNGNPLCDADSPDQCNSDPNMNALITYMQWLDEQYPATGLNGPIPNGFPVIPQKLPGNVASGQAIFLQKCAFCHGADGQGRYEDDVYFRPALWGPQSFNTDAGMAQTQTFAEFVKANMPHHSGGLLTDQEAHDLAAFVDSQPRPGSYQPPIEKEVK